ncbi:MAG: hypothetical protein ACXVIF_06495 [Halobacteriota archaeon]
MDDTAANDHNRSQSSVAVSNNTTRIVVPPAKEETPGLKRPLGDEFHVSSVVAGLIGISVICIHGEKTKCQGGRCIPYLPHDPNA